MQHSFDVDIASKYGIFDKTIFFFSGFGGKLGYPSISILFNNNSLIFISSW